MRNGNEEWDAFEAGQPIAPSYQLLDFDFDLVQLGEPGRRLTPERVTTTGRGGAIRVFGSFGHESRQAARMSAV